MNRIIISRAWCDTHLAECFHSFDKGTGESHHVGDPESIWPSGTAELAAEKSRLESIGYTCRHRGGQFIFTLWKAAPLDNENAMFSY
ncbi:MAG: hypothetical protein L0287_28665 [Anaerolineae bacterium]|nr:hypothetical protein [Anaerolineae bacterium]